MNDLFNVLADMYIKDTSCDGQLFCGCRDEDCINYKTKKCRNCLVNHIKKRIQNDAEKNGIENLKSIAKCIVEDLMNCGFDDVTDSSGYYIIKKIANGTDRAVDVYKSSVGGKFHYVIYCSYDYEDFDYKYTDDLSIEQLISKLEEFYMA